MKLSSVSQLDQIVRSVAWDGGLKGSEISGYLVLLLILGLKKVSGLEESF